MVVSKYLNCSTLSKIEFQPHREYNAHYKCQRTNAVYCYNRGVFSCPRRALSVRLPPTTRTPRHSCTFTRSKDTTNDATHTTSFQVDTSTTDTTERPFVCSGDYKCETYCTVLLFPQAYSKLQEGKCFLWPIAELHFALLAPRP